MDRNLELKQEYEALQKHSTLLTQQNKDLQRELDSFVETDDVVRRNLDRKEKVNMIRSSVNSAIQQSSSQVHQARTPTKQMTATRFQSERVSNIGGDAVKRSSYSGNYQRTVGGGLEQRGVLERGVMERGFMERGGTFENVKSSNNVFEGRSAGGGFEVRSNGGFEGQRTYQSTYQAGRATTRPVSYEFNTISGGERADRGNFGHYR